MERIGHRAAHDAGRRAVRVLVLDSHVCSVPAPVTGSARAGVSHAFVPGVTGLPSAFTPRCRVGNMSGLLGTLGVISVTSPWLSVPLMVFGVVRASAFAQAPQARTMSTLEQEISAAPPPHSWGRRVRDRQGTGRAGLRARRTAAGRRDRAAAEVPPTAHADRQRLHAGPQAPQRGHRAQESRGARPARQSRAAAACPGLHRDETRRLGASRAGTSRPGRARQRDLRATGLPGWTTMPASTRPRFAGCRTSSPRRRRLPARTTIWASATKRSTRPTRRSRTTARRCGSTASMTDALGVACAQSRHPAPHARGTGRGRGLVSRGVDLRSALRARLLPARRVPGATWTHGRGGEGAAAADVGRRRLCRAVLRVVTHLPAARPHRRSRRGDDHIQAAARRPAGASAVNTIRIAARLAALAFVLCLAASRRASPTPARQRSRPRRRSSRSPFCSNAATVGAASRPGRAGLEGASRRSRAAQLRRRHRRTAGRLRVGRGALSDGDSPRPTAAPPRTRTSDACIRSAPTAIPRCAPRRLRSTGGCWRPIPPVSKGLFQSGFLLALDGQFAASRAMLERLPEDVRQRPQALAVLAADLGGMGDTAAARRVVDALAAHPALTEADVLAVLPALPAGPGDAVAALMLDALDRRALASPRALQALAAIHVRAGAVRRGTPGARTGGRRRRRPRRRC